MTQMVQRVAYSAFRTLSKAQPQAASLPHSKIFGFVRYVNGCHTIKISGLFRVSCVRVKIYIGQTAQPLKPGWRKSSSTS